MPTNHVARLRLAELFAALALAGLRDRSGRVDTAALIAAQPVAPVWPEPSPPRREPVGPLLDGPIARRAARREAWGIAAVLLAILLASLARPAMASGPYASDDAAITPAGSGQVEAWVSLGPAGELWAFVPALTPKAVPWLELSLALDRARLAGERSAGLAPQAKALITREAAAPGEIGLALSAGVRASLDGDGLTDASARAILTHVAAPGLLLHVNLGLDRDLKGRTTDVAWAGRAELAAVPDRLTVHAEAFSAGRGEAGWQLGLRPTLGAGNLDLELIAGRNLAGERRSWVTLGFAARFGGP